MQDERHSRCAQYLRLHLPAAHASNDTGRHSGLVRTSTCCRCVFWRRSWTTRRLSASPSRWRTSVEWRLHAWSAGCTATSDGRLCFPNQGWGPPYATVQQERRKSREPLPSSWRSADDVSSTTRYQRPSAAATIIQGSPFCHLLRFIYEEYRFLGKPT